MRWHQIVIATALIVLSCGRGLVTSDSDVDACAERQTNSLANRCMYDVPEDFQPGGDPKCPNKCSCFSDTQYGRIICIGLTATTPTMFSSLTYLNSYKTLEIYDSPLETFDGGILWSGLQNLILKNCSLTCLTAKAYGNFCYKAPSLEFLLVEGNPLDLAETMKVLHHIDEGSCSLSTLCLKNNNLSSLSGQPFYQLSFLSHIDLSRNLLTSIGDDDFKMENSSNVNFVSLQYNKLQTISSNSQLGSVFQQSKATAKKLCLKRNEFVCNCSLSWTCPNDADPDQPSFYSWVDEGYTEAMCHDLQSPQTIKSWCEGSPMPCPTSNLLLPILGSVGGALAVALTASGIVFIRRRRLRRSFAPTQPRRRRSREGDRLLEESVQSVKVHAKLTTSRNRKKTKKGDTSQSEEASSGVASSEDSVDIMQSFFIPPGSLTKLKRIGEGGSGFVYKAKWNADIVAMKELRSMHLLEAEKEEFRREALLMSQLHHPNIVLLMGICLDEGSMCIVTEYMSRKSVCSILRPRKGTYKPLEQNRIRRMLLHAARGMAHLHCQNPPIIHRDLKCGNLLVDRDFNVKVADFGVAKMLDHFKKDRTHTKLPGTLLWTAPELMVDSPVLTKKADVYSFGIVVWEFVGAPEAPFSHLKTPYFFELAAEVKKGDRPIIPTTCPEDLKELMVTCWQHDYQKRPEFTDVINRLEQGNLLEVSIDEAESTSTAALAQTEEASEAN